MIDHFLKHDMNDGSFLEIYHVNDRSFSEIYHVNERSYQKGMLMISFM